MEMKMQLQINREIGLATEVEGHRNRDCGRGRERQLQTRK
jgi:hypothetical protein